MPPVCHLQDIYNHRHVKPTLTVQQSMLLAVATCMHPADLQSQRVEWIEQHNAGTTGFKFCPYYSQSGQGGCYTSSGEKVNEGTCTCIYLSGDLPAVAGYGSDVKFVSGAYAGIIVTPAFPLTR